jgi:hypothetical protein
MNRALVEQWRAYVSQHRLLVAVVGGLVATHVTTNTGMWYHGIGLPDLNFNLLNGYLVLGNSSMDPNGFQDPAILTLFGGIVHYAMGVSWALVFAFGVAPLLPIGETLLGNFTKAIIWGLILATLSSVWWINLFPNLGGSGVSAGLFFSNFGPDQLKYLVAVYLWHLVYAVHLGAFYNPAPAESTTAAT